MNVNNSGVNGNNWASLTLSPEKVEFIRYTQATINLFYPPRKKGFVETVQERIAHLLESEFATIKHVGAQLRDAAEQAAKKLNDENRNSRMHCRTVIVKRLENAITWVLPGLGNYDLLFAREGVYKQLCEEFWDDLHKADKFFQATRYPIDEIRINPFTLLQEAALDGRIDRVQFCLHHSSDINHAGPQGRAVFIAARSFPSRWPFYIRSEKRVIFKFESFFNHSLLKERVQVVEFLLNNRANVMTRNLSGYWDILDCMNSPITIFQTMMESIQDMSLTSGRKLIGQEVRQINVLEDVLRRFDGGHDDETFCHVTIPKAQILVFHGLTVPHEYLQTNPEGATTWFEINNRRVAHEQLRRAEEVYKTVHAEEELKQKLDNEHLRNQFLQSTKFPDVVIALVSQYRHDENYLRVTVSRRCIQELRLGTDFPFYHYLPERDPWAFSRTARTAYHVTTKVKQAWDGVNDWFESVNG